MEVKRLSKMQSTICNYIIVKEWIGNGEFDQTDEIIVIGTESQAVMVKSLFRKTDKKIYCCTGNEDKYKHKDRTKWIVFDGSVKKRFFQKRYDVLLVPDI